MKHLVLVLISAAGLVPASDALAQSGPRCAGRDDVLAGLAQGYGESRRGMGLAANDAVVEIFASDETGTWTIIVTTPTGMSCLVASGANCETIGDAALPLPGNPV